MILELFVFIAGTIGNNNCDLHSSECGQITSFDLFLSFYINIRSLFLPRNH